MPMIKDIQLSLYIHLPWCVQKCPYCDFNSHALKGNLPETAYVNALLDDFEQHLPYIQNRPLISIFFGGGTPSLFSGAAIHEILNGVAKRTSLTPDIEITLEANPGTVDEAQFVEFRQAGVNRLSLGIQSLQDEKLKRLGRIHDQHRALRAIERATSAGFTNFNLDIMYGLPEQTLDEALSDIEQALAFQPTHFSWYQLTIEPNTLFHHQPPILPSDDLLYEMQLAGQALLAERGFKQYEVSAYARDELRCQHNMNYWEYGDYLGIGAGAHSKLTDAMANNIERFSQVKHPRDYLLAEQRQVKNRLPIDEKERIFEFMLNGLRLTDGIAKQLFIDRTGLSLASIQDILDRAVMQQLLENNESFLRPTAQGKRFLNNLTTLFL
jgi:putative oxygen-independent coproporphyrinogen III oxidase